MIGSPRTGAGDTQLLNTGTGGRFVNGIHVSTNAATACLDVDTASTVAAAPRWDSVVFSCAIAFKNDSDVDGAAAQALFNAGTNNSSSHTSTLTGGFINGANEAARPAADPKAIYAFFDTTNYIGAVRDANDTWWQGWTCGLASGSSC